MLRKKTGYPKESELLLCTVSNIQYHSVFVSIDEYGKQGMIHISEISPGRIRNIRDYVKEGKVIVCKVLRVNLERGHIDLSLRRVSEGQRREKVNELKNEQKAEKILEIAAKQVKLDSKQIYDSVIATILEKYNSLFDYFADVAEEHVKLEHFPEAILKPLLEVINTRIKPKEVIIGGTFTLKTFQPDGIERIKKLLALGAKTGNPTLTYKGGGRYSVSITSTDYKEAEASLETITSTVIEEAKHQQVEATFTRK